MARYQWERRTNAEDVSADIVVERLDVQTFSHPRRYVKVAVVFADGRVNVLHYDEEQARAIAEALTTFVADEHAPTLN